MIKNYKLLILATAVTGALAFVGFFFKIPVLMGIAFWAIIAYLIIISVGKSILAVKTIGEVGPKEYAVIGIAALAVILLCILPMDIAPFWNGRIPMHRNQYELLADSILDGHLYIDYDDIDPRLLEMENPYDFMGRQSQGIDYHFDHAFYNGHYYMYFGVVPVFLVFIPFKLLLGRTLVTYHATQLFVMLSAIAFFILFFKMAKRFFPKMNIASFILSTIAIILITVGYCVQAPALYCTAISGGICLELWSILLFYLGVFEVKKEWLQVVLCTLAALAGALAFGCRPPVALANLIAIPMAVYYAKNNKDKHLVRNFIIIAIPYLIVGGLLMAYNYARFENPFEFGQSYQLTTYDQTSYTNFWSRIDIFRDIDGLFENFITPGKISSVFPFINYGGVLITYPLMMMIVPLYSYGSVRKELKKDSFDKITAALLITSIVITLADCHFAPGLCERYRLDFYFVMGILAFVLIGYKYKTTEHTKRFSTIVSLFAVCSILGAFLLFMQPCDANFAEYFPEEGAKVANVITFGLF